MQLHRIVKHNNTAKNVDVAQKLNEKQIGDA